MYAGITLDEAEKWKAKNIQNTAAIEFKTRGFSPSEAENWLNAGYNLDEAIKWKKAGVTLTKLSKMSQDEKNTYFPDSKIACNNTIIKNTVIGIAIQQYGNELAQMGIGSERFSVQNVRTRTKNNRSCNCTADLIIDLGVQKKKLSIDYIS